MNKMSEWLRGCSLLPDEKEAVFAFLPHINECSRSQRAGGDNWSSHELPLLGLTRSEVTQTTPPACTPLPPDQDCLEHHPSGDRSVTLCVHLRAHKYAFMTNWQDRTVHMGTKRKGYKDLVKRSSEVSVFSVSWYLNWAPLPHSWPTPSWDGRLGRFGPVQTVLRPSRCLLHTPTPTPTFNTLSGFELLQRWSWGQEESFSHLKKGEPGQTQFFLLFSDIRTLPRSCSLPSPPAASVQPWQGSQRQLKQ